MVPRACIVELIIHSKTWAETDLVKSIHGASHLIPLRVFFVRIAVKRGRTECIRNWKKKKQLQIARIPIIMFNACAEKNKNDSIITIRCLTQKREHLLHFTSGSGSDDFSSAVEMIFYDCRKSSASRYESRKNRTSVATCARIRFGAHVLQAHFWPRYWTRIYSFIHHNSARCECEMPPRVIWSNKLDETRHHIRPMAFWIVVMDNETGKW